MDTDKARQALEQAFQRDIEDGTVEVRREGAAAVVNGGSWLLTANVSGIVGLDLPMNDPNYYDEADEVQVKRRNVRKLARTF